MTIPAERLYTPQGEVEARMGLIPLEELLKERDELISRVARLRARHGTFGSWDSERKVALASAAALVRAQALQENKKMTESAIDEAAHVHPTYSDFVIASVSEKADWIVLEGQIDGIDFTIRRGDVVGRYLAQEAALAR